MRDEGEESPDLLEPELELLELDFAERLPRLRKA